VRERGREGGGEGKRGREGEGERERERGSEGARERGFRNSRGGYRLRGHFLLLELHFRFRQGNFVRRSHVFFFRLPRRLLCGLRGLRMSAREPGPLSRANGA